MSPHSNNFTFLLVFQKPNQRKKERAEAQRNLQLPHPPKKLHHPQPEELHLLLAEYPHLLAEYPHLLLIPSSEEL